MRYLSGLVAMATLLSAANASAKSVDRTTREFIAAIQRGLDPVAVGVIPSLTSEQSEQLKALGTCKAAKSDLSNQRRVLLIWQCGSGRNLMGYLTELTVDETGISGVLIEKLVARPVMDR